MSMPQNFTRYRRRASMMLARSFVRTAESSPCFLIREIQPILGISFVASDIIYFLGKVRGEYIKISMTSKVNLTKPLNACKSRKTEYDYPYNSRFLYLNSCVCSHSRV